MTTMINASALVEDFSLYPRNDVDNHHVSGLVHVLQSGVSLPPVIADQKSKRIVDGFHRRRAYQQLYGEAVEISCLLKKYKDESAMLLEAVAKNSVHGLALGGGDAVRAAHMLEDRGVSREQIRVALSCTEERVQKLLLRVVYTPGYSETIPGSTKVVVKPSSAHLAGTTMSAERATAMRSAPGTSYRLLIDQLSSALTHELIDRESGHTLDALLRLQKLLAAYLRKAE